MTTEHQQNAKLRQEPLDSRAPRAAASLHYPARGAGVGGAPRIHTCQRPRFLFGEHLNHRQQLRPANRQARRPARIPPRSSPNPARLRPRTPTRLPGRGSGAAASGPLSGRHLEKGTGGPPRPPGETPLPAAFRSRAPARAGRLGAPVTPDPRTTRALTRFAGGRFQTQQRRRRRVLESLRSPQTGRCGDRAAVPPPSGSVPASPLRLPLSFLLLLRRRRRPALELPLILPPPPSSPQACRRLLREPKHKHSSPSARATSAAGRRPRRHVAARSEERPSVTSAVARPLAPSAPPPALRALPGGAEPLGHVIPPAAGRLQPRATSHPRRPLRAPLLFGWMLRPPLVRGPGTAGSACLAALLSRAPWRARAEVGRGVPCPLPCSTDSARSADFSGRESLLTRVFAGGWEALTLRLAWLSDFCFGI
ncbi:proline-rich protein HaeIII subfamily 1-like [Bos javanicus]|uniref:proline-rich protein HaeIII subfamily 1-like n=1 Tax=Bos javanicus TaxID=9906 RepID=UPI002AA74610|nr:proline-rich protein HaeIII subfamily 1-like [Bos javanicus]